MNLNALGDRVVSFAVLALSVSPNGSMVAACTDRSRVIVLQVPQRHVKTWVNDGQHVHSFSLFIRRAAAVNFETCMVLR